MPSDMAAAALHYAEIGMAVIPLHGKKPFFENWPETATRDPGMISRWWTQEPTANIGIATGSKSNVFVVDIDPRNGGRDSWEELLEQHGPIPDTRQVVTGGGGTHIYFRYPAVKVPGIAGLWPGIDIKSDGGQVVAPPSIHPDTHQRYEWDGLAEFDDQPLAEAPDWLLDEFAKRQRPAKKELKALPVKIPKGVQHYTLVSLAGTLRRMGLDAEEMYGAVQSVNERRCERPGAAQNIRDICESMMRYQPGDGALVAIANKLWRMAAYYEKISEKAQGELIACDGLELWKAPAYEPQATIEGLLHTGLTVFAGRPKVGKSWLALQLALAVAYGTPLWGRRPILRPGRVAYLALEESKHRTASRLRRLTETGDPYLQNIEFIYQIAPMAQGGVDRLHHYLEHRKPSLCVIDTFLGFSGQVATPRNIVRSEYGEMASLKKVADYHGLPLVVVHHLNKTMGGDVFDRIVGTTGTTAVADCMWVLEKQDNGGALFQARGREIEDQSLALKLDLDHSVGWYMLAEGRAARETEQRDSIIDILRDEGALKPAKIASMIGKTQESVRQILKRMRDDGRVIRQRDGSYLVDHSYIDPDS